MKTTAQCVKNENQIVDWKNWCPKRGEIYVFNFGEIGILGSEFKGLRPAVVLSNNKNNQYSTVIQIAPLTSTQGKNNLPVHVELDETCGLRMSSVVCLEQARCVSKERSLIGGRLIKISQLNEKIMNKIDNAIKIQLGLV